MAPKTPTAKAPRAKRQPKVLPIIKNDPWLEPFAEAITGRHQEALNVERRLTSEAGTLSDFANAHKYFGLHKGADGKWTFREWAPNATAITLIGDFSDWQPSEKYALTRGDNGVWEGKFGARAFKHGQNYKMLVEWDGGRGERIPAYADRVVQDPETHLFSAQVWAPKQAYEWKVNDFVPDTKPLLIYECHIGMAQEREGVGTYDEFRENVLPRITPPQSTFPMLFHSKCFQDVHTVKKKLCRGVSGFLCAFLKFCR